MHWNVCKSYTENKHSQGPHLDLYHTYYYYCLPHSPPTEQFQCCWVKLQTNQTNSQKLLWVDRPCSTTNCKNGEKKHHIITLQTQCGRPDHQSKWWLVKTERFFSSLILWLGLGTDATWLGLGGDHVLAWNRCICRHQMSPGVPKDIPWFCRPFGSHWLEITPPPFPGSWSEKWLLST